MLTGLSNIFKNINDRRKICKSVTIATHGSHHGALQNFPFFFTIVRFFFFFFVQDYFNILKLMFMKFDMSVKFKI